ncbi:uncharacterized protein LOC130783241 [Actinidia eriantha]|uniref:uncharacterized protein LOC130783241 n=1 Tax=Actinidia eriantha TaxID=165200 RepID=UPI00258D3231|nr:uncharacterized protein LOC130783241 [Actinidia eriantha]
MISLKKIEGRILRKLVWPLALIQFHGAAIWGRDYFTVQVSSGELMGTLRLNSSCFDQYICYEPTRTWLNLEDLNDIISFIVDDECLIVSAATSWNDQVTYVHFVFEILGTVRFTTKTLRGGPIPNHHRDMNESEFAYEVVVGIPSEKFRRIIRHFYQPGLPFVEAFVIDDEVTFRIGSHEDIVLTTAGGDCVIGGTYDFYRVIIRIYLLDCPDSYIAASENCNTVWLLQSEGDSPDMVYFPLGELGNFMFYRNR